MFEITVLWNQTVKDSLSQYMKEWIADNTVVYRLKMLKNSEYSWYIIRICIMLSVRLKNNSSQFVKEQIASQQVLTYLFWQLHLKVLVWFLMEGVR